MIDEIYAGSLIKITKLNRLPSGVIELEYDNLNKYLLGIIIDNEFITLKNHTIIPIADGILTGSIDSIYFDNLKSNSLCVYEFMTIDWKNTLDVDKIESIEAAKSTYKWYQKKLNEKEQEKNSKIVKFPRNK